MMPTMHSDSTEAGWLAVASIDQDIAEAAAGTASHTVEHTQVHLVEAAAQSDPEYRSVDPAGAGPGDSPTVPARPTPAQPQPDTLLGNGPRFSNRRSRFRIPREAFGTFPVC